MFISHLYLVYKDRNGYPVQTESIMKSISTSSNSSISSSTSKLTRRDSALSSMRYVSSGTVQLSAGGQALQAENLFLDSLLGSRLNSKEPSNIRASGRSDITRCNTIQGLNERSFVEFPDRKVLCEPGVHHLEEVFTTQQFFHYPAVTFSGQFLEDPGIFIPGLCKLSKLFRRKMLCYTVSTSSS